MSDFALDDDLDLVATLLPGPAIAQPNRANAHPFLWPLAATALCGNRIGLRVSVPRQPLGARKHAPIITRDTLTPTLVATSLTTGSPHGALVQQSDWATRTLQRHRETSAGGRIESVCAVLTLAG